MSQGRHLSRPPAAQCVAFWSQLGLECPRAKRALPEASLGMARRVRIGVCRLALYRQDKCTRTYSSREKEVPPQRIDLRHREQGQRHSTAIFQQAALPPVGSEACIAIRRCMRCPAQSQLRLRAAAQTPASRATGRGHRRGPVHLARQWLEAALAPQLTLSSEFIKHTHRLLD